MPTVIPPTVGRVVWFFYRGEPSRNFDCGPDAPHAAIISKVYSDRMVNLAAFSTGGECVPFGSVTLVQEGDPKPPGSYCAWMPYQLGQARRAVGPAEQT